MKKDIKLSDILSISGHPGLYKYVAQGTNGLIVESLVDGKRMNMPPTARVSSMGEIAIYTDEGDMPLAEIFESIFAKTEGKQTISHKSSPEQMKELLEQVAPNYDQDRVHVSDMKKILSWYNSLIEMGITDFSVEQDEEESKAEPKGVHKTQQKGIRTEQKAQPKGPQRGKQGDQQKKVKK